MILHILNLMHIPNVILLIFTPYTQNRSLTTPHYLNFLFILQPHCCLPGIYIRFPSPQWNKSRPTSSFQFMCSLFPLLAFRKSKETISMDSLNQCGSLFFSRRKSFVLILQTSAATDLSLTNHNLFHHSLLSWGWINFDGVSVSGMQLNFGMQSRMGVQSLVLWW